MFCMGDKAYFIDVSRVTSTSDLYADITEVEILDSRNTIWGTYNVRATNLDGAPLRTVHQDFLFNTYAEAKVGMIKKLEGIKAKVNKEINNLLSLFK